MRRVGEELERHFKGVPADHVGVEDFLEDCCIGGEVSEVAVGHIDADGFDMPHTGRSIGG